LVLLIRAGDVEPEQGETASNENKRRSGDAFAAARQLLLGYCQID
jgi:hypothetical protein